MTRSDRVLLAAIGSEGLLCGAISILLDGDPAPLDPLCDGGYVWVSDPDAGPFYCLSDLGREALAAARPELGRSPDASGRPDAPDSHLRGTRRRASLARPSASPSR